MNKKMLLTGAFLLVGSLANAQTIKGTDVQTVMNAAKKYGPVELKKEKDGTPYLTGKIAGYTYNVSFGKCNARATQCEYMSLWAIWDGVDLNVLNDWNKSKLAGRAYVDQDGDTNLDLWVNLYGGVSSTMLDDTFDWWEALVKGFAKTMP